MILKNFIYSDVISYYVYKLFRTIGFSLSNTFVPIYLYMEIGYSIGETLMFITIIHFFVIPFIPFTNYVVKIIGVKKSMSLHVFGMSLFFYLLQFLSGSFYSDLYFIILLGMIKSIPKSFYSLSDTIFINEKILKNKVDFGKKLSYIHIIMIIAGILSPFIGGFLTFLYGFNNFFNIISIFILIGVLPLIFTKDFKVDFKIGYSKLLKFILKKLDNNFKIAVFGQEFSSSILQTVWPIFLIIIVGTTLNVGILLSITAFISILASYIVGVIIDKKDFSKYFKIIVNISSIVFFFRVLFPNPILLAITDSINRILLPIFEIPFEKYIYKYIHSFKGRSFVSTAYIFYFEVIYLIGFLIASIYFLAIEYFNIEYNYLVFVIIFILYGIIMLFTKNITRIKLIN